MIPWGRNNDELLNESLFFGLDHARSAPLLNGRTITTVSGRTHRSDTKTPRTCRDHRRNDFGPIKHTTVSISEDEESGEIRETHRRSNLKPFLDDPDCWLVASIEDYDLETDKAKPGPIFTERVISPPAPPVITSAGDALAVVLSKRRRVDPEHTAELLHRDPDAVIDELGDAIFRDLADGSWQTSDAYCSGPVRTKLMGRRSGGGARSSMRARCIAQ